jgi:hypothetical protein
MIVSEEYDGADSSRVEVTTRAKNQRSGWAVGNRNDYLSRVPVDTPIGLWEYGLDFEQALRSEGHGFSRDWI